MIKIGDGFKLSKMYSVFSVENSNIFLGVCILGRYFIKIDIKIWINMLDKNLNIIIINLV